MEIEKTDIFRKLIEEGILNISGLDKNSNSYRVFEFQGKKFRLTLTEEETKPFKVDLKALKKKIAGD